MYVPKYVLKPKKDSFHEGIMTKSIVMHVVGKTYDGWVSFSWTSFRFVFCSSDRFPGPQNFELLMLTSKFDGWNDHKNPIRPFWNEKRFEFVPKYVSKRLV